MTPEQRAQGILNRISKHDDKLQPMKDCCVCRDEIAQALRDHGKEWVEAVAIMVEGVAERILNSEDAPPMAGLSPKIVAHETCISVSGWVRDMKDEE